MTPRTRHTWFGFGAGALLGVVGLTLLTTHALRTDHEVAEANLEAQWEEDLRTALYRMDQRFAPLLARAVARTEQPGVATLDRGYEVRLPEGIAEPDDDSATNPDLLVAANDAWMNGNPTPELEPFQENIRGNDLQQLQSRGRPRSTQEYGSRVGINRDNNTLSNVAPTLDTPLVVGPLVPSWEGADDSRLLAFARIVEEGEATANQVFRLAWSPLEELLIAEVIDLFPEASLEPIPPEEALGNPAADLLASMPARLAVDPVGPVPGPSAALRTTLLMAWLLGLAALIGFGLALRSGLADAARQRRFTRAVTHELRTPLTTFRMYSEMLAAGMVPEDRRHEYLTALESESGRLGALVENVLAHARLEEGRQPVAREELTLANVVERHRAVLERRCAQANTRLECSLGDAGALRVTTDADSVGQVLSNLVDNACKYGAPPEGHHPGAALILEGRCEEQTLALILRDPGPGIPAEQARAIFRPFDRAGREESDAAPGVGLGLALCRDLARELGGALELEGAGSSGGVFVLRLPRALG